MIPAKSNRPFGRCLARYFMYTQVYFHDVRRAYDMHLKEFLLGYLGRAYALNLISIRIGKEHLFEKLRI